MAKTKVFSFRLPPEHYERAAALAAEVGAQPADLLRALLASSISAAWHRKTVAAKLTETNEGETP